MDLAATLSLFQNLLQGSANSTELLILTVSSQQLCQKCVYKFISAC